MGFPKASTPNLDVEPPQRPPRTFASRIFVSLLVIVAIASLLLFWMSSRCPNSVSLDAHTEDNAVVNEIKLLDNKPRPRWLLLGYEGGESCSSGSVFSNQGDKSTWCINVPTEPRVPERVNWYPGQYWKLCTWNSANCTGQYSSALTGQGKCQNALTQSYMIMDARRECIGLEGD
ncbi:unnamed protein product [Clonostachys rhizophaga]|uniref:Uncharacterized protein n=1 Tax=Clonostachys rhizophaga TaxID=160324 RepID=A0A9N9W0D5_9HYPO|nr:unnamed protein product [Clonostachys rhizophaga]